MVRKGVKVLLTCGVDDCSEKLAWLRWVVRPSSASASPVSVEEEYDNCRDKNGSYTAKY